jgi:redox-sensitive bicupin YhaK (pirin superfamily)
MTTVRSLSRVYTPQGQPGFLGQGHIARPVIQGDFSETDPFILLMDDILDKKDDEPAGGPHPHAGFETVTLVLEGKFGEGAHAMKAGDFALMTAGEGIVHTETITGKTRLRILQLWLNLPKKDRWTLPRIQTLPFEHVPVTNKEGVEVRVYSGSFAGLTSSVQNHTPMIIADIKMNAGTTLQDHIPGDFNTFFYVIKGSVNAGDDATPVKADQVAWVDYGHPDSELRLDAGPEGARLVLYSAEPQKHAIVSHGPFIADSMDEIKQLYADFRHGKFEHINNVAESQQVLL